MDAFNAILTRVTDLLLAPLALWPLAALAFWSAVSGVAMAWVFKWVTPQRALGRAAEQVSGSLLGVKLFKHDGLTTLRLQGRLLAFTAWRFALSLPAAAVLAVPFVLILAHLGMRYQWQPLPVGQTALVTVWVEESDWDRLWDDITLEPPDGVTVQTPALRDAADCTVRWRIAADRDVVDALRVRIGPSVVDKPLVARTGSSAAPIITNPRRAQANWADRILYPAEPAIDRGSPVRAIQIDYPLRSTPVLGVDVPWWLTFLVISMLAALAAKPWVRVKF